MGSEIVDPDTEEIVWGRAAALFQSKTALRLALPIEPGERTTFVPGRSILRIGPVGVYADLGDALFRTGAFRAGSNVGPLPSSAILSFNYDWRLSCAENAERLAAFITSIQGRRPTSSPKIDILAHSMGGMIARYYILYGGCDVLDEKSPVPNFSGANNVRKLVLLGTPSMGSVGAFIALVKGRRVGPAFAHPDILATMPAMIELMPSPSETILWTPDGKPAPLNIYDVSTWKEQRWGIFDPSQTPGVLRRYQLLHDGASDKEARAYLADLQVSFGCSLRRAEAFHRALEARSIPPFIETLVLGGDCRPTLRSLVVEQDHGRWVIRFSPKEVERRVKGVDLRRLFYAPGDGDVTKASALGDLVATDFGAAPMDSLAPKASFACDDHVGLIKNRELRENLISFLLPRSVDGN